MATTQRDAVQNAAPFSVASVDDGKSNTSTKVKLGCRLDPAAFVPSSTACGVLPSDVLGTASQQVFHIAELLEDVLSCLDPADILRAMSVQRYWRDTIDGSVKLKRLLGLAPGGKFFYSPFCGSSIESAKRDERGRVSMRPFKEGEHFAICSVGHPYVWDDPDSFRGRAVTSSYEISFDITAVARSGPLHHEIDYEPLLQRLGSRVRDMAISNPPLKALDISLECWNCSYQYDRDGHEAWPNIESTSERGFTVGDLADAVRVIAKSEHRPCTSRCFFIRSKVELDPEDPIVKSWIVAREDDERRRELQSIVKAAFESNQWRAERDYSCNNEPIELTVKTKANNYDDDGQEVSADITSWAASVLRGPRRYADWDSDYDIDEDDEDGDSDEGGFDDGDEEEASDGEEASETSGAELSSEEEDFDGGDPHEQEPDGPNHLAAPTLLAEDEDKKCQGGMEPAANSMLQVVDDVDLESWDDSWDSKGSETSAKW